MSPLQIAQSAFEKIYQVEMPAELTGLFQEAYWAATHKRRGGRRMKNTGYTIEESDFDRRDSRSRFYSRTITLCRYICHIRTYGCR